MDRVGADNLVPYYFKVAPQTLDKPEIWKMLDEIVELGLGNITGTPSVVQLEGGKNDKLMVFQGKNGSYTSVRVYGHGLVTFDLHHFIEGLPVWHEHPYNMEAFSHVRHFLALSDRKPDQLSEEFIRTMESKVRAKLGDLCLDLNSMYSPIKRGQPVWPYAISADERIQELDYDEIVYEKRSEYQNIRIMHSKEFGNVLSLDGDAMLGESDLIYTKTLLGSDQLSFKDKRILILGGGDGGVLYELLKEDPKFVIMAEIDEHVVLACRKHMRSVCGEAMDKYEGPNYKIVFEDCLDILHNNIQKNDLFDYVINDLTEFPVEKTLKGFGYDFKSTSRMTEFSLKALKPGGRILARGNCWGAVDYREEFEGEIEKMGADFKRKDVFVPSFQETYCLYEIWKKGE